MDNRQKHGWLFWFAVGVIALPVLYIASFGPACWLTGRTSHLGPWVAVVYGPLGRVAAYSEHPVNRPLRWYAGLFAEKSYGTMYSDWIEIPVGEEREGGWEYTSWRAND
jgi:hypothetical protein